MVDHQYNIQKIEKESALDAAIRNECMATISKKAKSSATIMYIWKKKYISNELEHLLQNDSHNINDVYEIDKLRAKILSLKKVFYLSKMEKATELIKKKRPGHLY